MESQSSQLFPSFAHPLISWAYKFLTAIITCLNLPLSLSVFLSLFSAHCCSFRLQGIRSLSTLDSGRPGLLLLFVLTAAFWCTFILCTFYDNSHRNYAQGPVMGPLWKRITSIWQSKHPTKICNAMGRGGKVLMKLKGANHVMKRA